MNVKGPVETRPVTKIREPHKCTFLKYPHIIIWIRIDIHVLHNITHRVFLAAANAECKRQALAAVHMKITCQKFANGIEVILRSGEKLDISP